MGTWTLGVMVKDPEPEPSNAEPSGFESTCSLHCSSVLGLPYRILIIYLVKPKIRNYNGDYR